MITAAANATTGDATLTFAGTSGSLSHSVNVTATISAPSADYTLALAPTSLTIMAGATGSQVSVAASAVNSFTGTVTVAITGLPAGVTANPATLSLAPGVAQSTTLSAAITAPASTATVTFTGTSGSLAHSAPLALTVQAAPMTNAPDVTTYHYNVSRDGLNAKETILTQANVNFTQFGKIGFYAVDGKVDAQPLYLANVVIGNQFHNVLYIATEHASVYAFDADSGAQIWKTSILGTGETTSDDHGCSQITPEIGITSTPVIDRTKGANGTLFTVGMSKDMSGKYHHRLHALDITTGAEISGSPTEIAASYPGTGANTQNGNVIFDPTWYAERQSLLLLNGTIYTGWTSHYNLRFKVTDSGLAVMAGGKSIPVPLTNIGPVSANDMSAQNVVESYTLTLVRGDRRHGHQPVTDASNGNTSFGKPFDNIGAKSIPDYADYANTFIHSITIPGCSTPGKVFVGQRMDGFVVNLGETFDLVNIKYPVEELAPPGVNARNAEPNTLADKNVTSLALEIPIACLTAGSDPVIGGWTTASLRQARVINPAPESDKSEASVGAKSDPTGPRWPAAPGCRCHASGRRW